MGTSTNTLRHTIEFLEGIEVIEKAGGNRLGLHPDLGILVGVDVTKTSATVAVSRFDFELLQQDVAQREIEIENPDASLRAIAALIAEQLARCAEEEEIREKLVGVGLALPGPVLRQPNPDESSKEAAQWDRRVRAGTILPGWDGVDVGARLANLLTTEHGLHPPRREERRFVWVENDASAGALGVHTELRIKLAEEAPDDLIYVRVTSGIGTGIVNKGHLVTGARGFAGEIGHVAVDRDGALCPACGGRGCLETVASERSVTGQLAAIFPEPSSGVDGSSPGPEGEHADFQRHLEHVLELPHPAVDRALWDAGWHVGEALAKACALLNPSLIVLGGLMPEHRSKVYPAGGSLPQNPEQPFVWAVERALEENTMLQTQENLGTTTWRSVCTPNQVLTPELLGALALVVDHLGDAYLLRPIERWIRSPESRAEPLSFSEPCGQN